MATTVTAWLETLDHSFTGTGSQVSTIGAVSMYNGRKGFQLRFDSKAHAVLAEFAAAHPGETFKATEITAAVAPTYVITGDHAIKLDGSTANEQPACNCCKDPGTALFIRSEGPDGQWRFTPRQGGEGLVSAGAAGLRVDAADELQIAAGITFGLERDLQLALRGNIGQLEEGLRIIDEGKERITDAGRIDITAIDKNDTIVVIELKAGMASPEAVAQVLAYMGAVAASDHKPVRGMLVAGDFHRRVVLASRAIPNLELKTYSYQFSFETVS